MEPVFEFGLTVTRWLQQNYPQLTGFMSLVSNLGRFEFYLALVPLVYWCLDKQAGKYMAYLLAVSNIVVEMLKHTFRGPRPFWLDPDVGLGFEDSYGVPSGHSQTAVVVYLFVGYWLRRGWVWLLCLLMIFFMGLSRVYLGVHFVHDVLAGYLVGLILMLGFLVWMRYFRERFLNRILGQRLLSVTVVPLFFGAIYAIIRLIIGQPDLTVSWVAYIETAERASIENIASALGILAGLGIGFILEASRVYFTVGGPVSKRVLRYVLGMVITLIIWRGLALVLPDDPLWLALPLRALRYGLAGIWVAYYAPIVFVRLKLAETSAGPDAKLKISDGNIMRG